MMKQKENYDHILAPLIKKKNVYVLGVIEKEKSATYFPIPTPCLLDLQTKLLIVINLCSLLSPHTLYS